MQPGDAKQGPKCPADSEAELGGGFSSLTCLLALGGHRREGMLWRAGEEQRGPEEPSTPAGSRQAHLEVGENVCPLRILMYLIPNSSETSATREGHVCHQGPEKGYQDHNRISHFRARELGL